MVNSPVCRFVSIGTKNVHAIISNEVWETYGNLKQKGTITPDEDGLIVARFNVRSRLGHVYVTFNKEVVNVFASTIHVSANVCIASVSEVEVMLQDYESSDFISHIKRNFYNNEGNK